MTKTINPASFHLGQLVQDQRGEYYTIERFDSNNYHDGGFVWKIWVRPIDDLAHIPIPANCYELKPVRVN